MSETTPSDLGEELARATHLLEEVGIETARLDGIILLSEALEISRSHLLIHREDPFPEDRRERWEEFLHRRKQREPVAYITGSWEFMSLDFSVDKRVLIPRPETELLVEEVIYLMKPGYRACDLGTGSGCIPISLAVHSEPGELFATDISREALEVARENARRHGVQDLIEFFSGDLFEALPVDLKVDCLTMNPPYIGEEERSELDRDLDYEPDLALYAADRGFAFYRRLADQSTRYLRSGGWLVLEIGDDQGKEILQCFSSRKNFTNLKIHTDYQGHDRIFVAQNKR